MKNKERLLSFDEKVSFIFSHSALREGWDNPNIFQICTLNQTVSEIKKRQEVGRGVRLAVDQSGNRVLDEKVNVLTVVANESYKSYVEQLQAELEQEYGRGEKMPKPENARRRVVARLRKQYTLRPEFQELWERIKQRTRYAVVLDSRELLDAVAPEIGRIEVIAPRIVIRKAELVVAADDSFDAREVGAGEEALETTDEISLPNLVDLMSNLMENTAPPVRITRSTIHRILVASQNFGAAVSNPQEFSGKAVRIIEDELVERLVHGIKYEKINEWYEMSRLDAEFESWKDHLVSAQNSLYDFVPFDSEIERRFVADLERRKDVKLYFKLPRWFTVQTPLGDYNPDWAIIFEERDTHGKPTNRPLIYLVCETKGRDWQFNLRPEERRKLECGQRHFEDTLDVGFKVVAEAAELP